MSYLSQTLKEIVDAIRTKRSSVVEALAAGQVQEKDYRYTVGYITAMTDVLKVIDSVSSKNK
jgi:hypothetical protein